MCIGVDSEFAERVEVGVEQARAEVLRLADDRRERHPVEDVAHLLGDGLERAADDLQRDRVDLAGSRGMLDVHVVILHLLRRRGRWIRMLP